MPFLRILHRDVHFIALGPLLPTTIVSPPGSSTEAGGYLNFEENQQSFFSLIVSLKKQVLHFNQKIRNGTDDITNE